MYEQARSKRIVTKIDANPLLQKRNAENGVLRVAAYCRVSTDSEDQIESYNAQVAHYTEAIMKNPKWRFVKIYADEGITGTLAKKREQFIKMIRDCEKGKIDLILTKSFSRFARNTVDSLRYVRKLKALGIGVFFEEQNLNSLTADSEMFVGLYSVMAQAESENISANVRWGLQQRMRAGTFAFRYNILGYRKGEDGEPEIVPEEAEIVLKIYNLYLSGYSVKQIKEYLEQNNIPTKKGKSQWGFNVISNILTNERYCGDMLLQKTFTENCITKKVKKNRGEMAKYFIANNHVPIVSSEMFKKVQREMARRRGKRQTSDKGITSLGKYSGKFALSELLVCGECGSPYKRVTWVKNGVSRKVWRCLSRVEHGKKFCTQSPALDETKLHAAICRGLTRLLENKEDVLEMIISNLSCVMTGEDDVLESDTMENQIRYLRQQVDDNVQHLNSTEGNKSKYIEVIRQLNDKIAILQEQLEAKREKIAANPSLKAEIDEIRETLTNTELCFSQYDDIIIRRLVGLIRVTKDKSIVIYLKGGLSVTEAVE